MSAPPVAPRTLAEWLDHQHRAHPLEIELGLGRVREVWLRLGAPRPAPIVITVGGTNGKGSTVAFLDAILGAQGCRVGCYTSPHLLRYNERVRVAGIDASDDMLVAAFERIEAARGSIALTWFEFGTLAALLVFAASALDVAVLEVGLGGRLDAVNIIDADVAVVTTIALDHEDWLGNDLVRIAREKAGIFRPGRVAVIGDPHAPDVLREVAEQIGARTLVAGRDYHIERLQGGWRWRFADLTLELPDPRLAAACQHANAAAALVAAHVLGDRIGRDPLAFPRGIAAARVPARLQRFAGAVELLVDVAHNPQAALVLADWLRAHPPAGRQLAVFAALADKDIEGIVAPLRDAFAHWCLAGLERETSRGLDAATLGHRLADSLAGACVSMHADVEDALADAHARARPGDRIVAFGSFFVAAVALAGARRDRLDEI